MTNISTCVIVTREDNTAYTTVELLSFLQWKLAQKTNCYLAVLKSVRELAVFDYRTEEVVVEMKDLNPPILSIDFMDNNRLITAGPVGFRIYDILRKEWSPFSGQDASAVLVLGECVIASTGYSILSYNLEKKKKMCSIFAKNLNSLRKIDNDHFIACFLSSLVIYKANLAVVQAVEVNIHLFNPLSAVLVDKNTVVVISYVHIAKWDLTSNKIIVLSASPPEIQFFHCVERVSNTTVAIAVLPNAGAYGVILYDIDEGEIVRDVYDTTPNVHPSAAIAYTDGIIVASDRENNCISGYRIDKDAATKKFVLALSSEKKIAIKLGPV